MCFEIKCAMPSVSRITCKKLPLARNLRVIMTCYSTVRAWFLLVSLSRSFLIRSDKNIMLSLPNRYLSWSSSSGKSRERSSIDVPSTYYLWGIDGDRDVTRSCITGYDVTGSCITENDVTGNDVTRYDVTGTGSREPETENEREIISRVYLVFPAFSPELL